MMSFPSGPPLHPDVASMDDRSWLLRMMRHGRHFVDGSGKMWSFDDGRNCTGAIFWDIRKNDLSQYDGESDEDLVQRERDLASLINGPDAVLSQVLKKMRDPSSFVKLLARVHLHLPHRLLFFTEAFIYNEDGCQYGNVILDYRDVRDLYTAMVLRRQYCDPKSNTGTALTDAIARFCKVREERRQLNQAVAK